MSEVNKPNPQLSPSRFQLAEQVCNTFAVTVEPGLTPAQIMHPDFLGHIAAKLRPYDELKVRCDDGSLYARLLVLQTDRAWARTRVLEWHNLTTKDVAQTEAALQTKESPNKPPADAADAPYRCEYKGPHLKWVVIRNSDGAVLQDKLADKAAAHTWRDEYIKVVA